MNRFFKYILIVTVVINVYAKEDYTEFLELKKQSELLLERINSYEKNRGSLELKNSDSILSVGGRIQLHSIYGWPDEGAYFAGKVPLDAQGEDGQLSMSSRYSRLWIKTRTPSKYGPIRALIETDFLGVEGTEANTNSHGLRLRHAYVELAGFTVGQTNSAFNSLVTLDTIAFVINDAFVRQPLVKYSIESKSLAYDISFEQPETTLLDKNATAITPKDDLVPDIIARVRYYPTWGEASLAFLSRYIKQDMVELSDVSIKSDDGAFGWGVNISCKIKVFELDDIRFDAQYGLGLGRYISYNAYKAGFIDDAGNIKLQKTFGGHLGYRHFWNKELRSTLAVSFAGSENYIDEINQLDRDSVNKNAYSLQANLLWVPAKNTSLGIEYAKAIREVESKEEGIMDILTLLFRYDF